ncbi:MAG: nucleotidyltransferase domain-containing protein [Dehalococcoidia bacterium]|nr:nucleotidyltransferase domain-containing protein [Dehalococcoidia bacterium]
MATDLAEARARHVARLDSELPRIVEALKGLGAELVLLFGSYAAGRRDLLTDLDLIAVMESDLPFVPRLAAVYRRVAPRVAVDILCYTPEEFAEMRHKPFVREALRTGTVLHGHP